MMDQRVPRAGHTFLPSGLEVYDVGAHILRAFEDLAPGVQLTIREVRLAGCREDVPKSWELGMGAITARLHSNTLPNIKCERNSDGVTVAYKVA